MLRWSLRLKGPRTASGTAVTVRRCVYLFRGDGDDEKQIEVHIFNTVSLIWRKWTPVTPGRERHPGVPSRRRGYTVVLIEDIVYLWGGYSNHEYYNRLYAFDVDAHRWFDPQVSGTVPEGRENHTACVLGKVMYIHGGINVQASANDIYELDTATMVWSLIDTRGTSPPASSHHSATMIGTKMFVFGGFAGLFRDNNTRQHIRVFDTETNLWWNTRSARLLPDGCNGHSAFTYNGELYIFGGMNRNQTLNNMWKFSPESFSCTEVEPKGEGPCSGMIRMCCCMVGDCIVLFGGFKLLIPMGNGIPFTSYDDLYVLDFSPSLKTLCKLAVIQYGLEQSDLTHDIRWELEAMTTNSN